MSDKHLLVGELGHLATVVRAEGGGWRGEGAGWGGAAAVGGFDMLFRPFADRR